MKKKSLILTMLVSIGIAPTLMAQKKEGAIEIKYRRSSLHTILIESDNFHRKETVLKAYNNAPFPDKYNEHTIGEKSFDPRKYAITDEERAAAGKKQSAVGKLVKDVISDAADMPLVINKYFKENKIADQLAAKWFNRQANGSFDMSLIGERGFYDATEMQANIAKGTVRGTASLADAGEELIKNTFVVVSKLNFVSNEIVAAATRKVAKSKARDIKVPTAVVVSKLNFVSNEIVAAATRKVAKKAALKAADKAYEKTKEGYSVWTTAYLYQLKWNDSIQAVFYTDLWMDKSNIDPAKKEAFDKTDLFELEFVGDEKSTTLVLFSLKEKRTEEQIIEMATIRNIDAVYAKLQKKYDVFKTKTPLHTGNPITAKIGMKEGLEGGEKFEVLEQTMDTKTGLTKYVSKGKITVNQDLIWDNRYNIGEDVETENPEIKATTFKGGKKFYSGLLIRQLK